MKREIVLSGHLSFEDIECILNAQATLRLSNDSKLKIVQTRTLLEDLAKRSPIYGFNRRVGPGKAQDAPAGYDWTLITRHATRLSNTSEEVLEASVLRLALAVLLNGLSLGQSTCSVEAVEHLASCFNVGRINKCKVEKGVGLGAADLVSLSQMMAQLLQGFSLKPGDALPLISSNAVTYAHLYQLLKRIQTLLVLSTAIVCLTLFALEGGNFENAFLAVVGPRRGAFQICRLMQQLCQDCTTEDNPNFIHHHLSLRDYVHAAGSVLDCVQGLQNDLLALFNYFPGNPAILEGRVVATSGYNSMNESTAVEGLKQALAKLLQSSALRTEYMCDLMEGDEIYERNVTLLQEVAVTSAIYYSGNVHSSPSSSRVGRGTEDFFSLLPLTVSSLERMLPCFENVICIEAFCAAHLLTTTNRNTLLSPSMQTIAASFLQHFAADQVFLLRPAIESSMNTSLSVLRRFGVPFFENFTP